MNLRFPRGGPRGPQDPPPPWLSIIYAANRISPGIFGEPTYVGPREGFSTVEEYADADVKFPTDDALTVRIVAKTERGNEVLRQVAAQLEGKSDGA